jgi:hypothetical protein
MTVWEDNDQPRRQSETARPPRINWRASAWVLVILAALVGLLLCAGCNGTGRKPAPAQDAALPIAAAAQAIEPELATVCTSTMAIRAETEALVPAVVEAAKTAPAPAATIAAGHRAIDARAKDAEAAATRAGVHAAAIEAQVAAVQGDRAALVADYEAEVAALAAALAKEREQSGSKLRQWGQSGMALGLLVLLAGIAGMVWLPGARTIAAGVAVTGGVCLAVCAAVYRFAEWLPWLGLAFGLALVTLAGWLLWRHRQALAGAVGFGENLKAGATVAQAENAARETVPSAARALLAPYIPHAGEPNEVSK